MLEIRRDMAVFEIIVKKRFAFFLKKVAEKFGGNKKSSTFAIPIEKWDITSSLKRLKTVQEASTEKYNLSRSVNSFERIRSVSIKLRFIEIIQ